MNANEDLMSDLIQKAETAKHRQFQFIISFREYLNIRKLKRAHVLLVSSIDKSANKLFKKYCKDVTKGNEQVIKLIAYCTVVNILKFYEEELRILEDMLEEYECYLFADNWTDFIFGTVRPVDKLWDHRGE